MTTSPETSSPDGPRKQWAFLTSHALVLLCIADDPDVLLREVADRIGITERAVQRILADLEEAGYVTHERVGRRNSYTVIDGTPMRHPLVRDHEVRGLVELLGARSRG